MTCSPALAQGIYLLMWFWLLGGVVSFVWSLLVSLEQRNHYRRHPMRIETLLASLVIAVSATLIAVGYYLGCEAQRW